MAKKFKRQDISGSAAKDLEENRITTDIEQELTDDQLVQLAEGASSWGANCNSSSSCNSD